MKKIIEIKTRNSVIFPGYYQVKSDKLMHLLVRVLLSALIMVMYTINSGLSAQSPLCSSYPTLFCCEYVSSVTINGVTMNGAPDATGFSSGPGYFDYTGSSMTSMVAGNTYPVSVTVKTNSIYEEYVKIWFDFNGNGTLADDGELVFNQVNSFYGTYTYSGNVTIPSTAFNGDIYIRVVMVYANSPALCGSYSYGTTLDFKATISGGTTARNLSVTTSGTGGYSGSVTSSPDGINTASGFNSANFSDQSIVTLTATASGAGIFTGWSGDVSGTSNPLNITMNASKNVTANFSPPVTTPTVTTTAISSISQTSASGGGNVTATGGSTVTGRGICWNISGSPIISDSKTTDGSGSGSFISSLTDLSAGTTYYVRAYATNSNGTGYGNQVSFTALRNSQTVTFSDLPTKTFGDGDFAPDASATSGLPVTFTSSNTGVATIVGSDIHIVSAGTSVITANQAGNSTWLPASANQTLTVNKSNQTITFDYLNTGDPKTYGSADFDPSATSSSGLTVTYSSDNTSVATIVSGKIHFAGAGTANITATQAGNSNYNAATEVVQNLVVSKADLTATADNKSRVYGASNPVFTISYSGFVNSDNEGVIDSKPTASVTADVNSNAGDYTITTTGGSDNNYNITLVNATLTIAKSHLTVTAEGKSKVYGDANPQLTFLYSGFVNGENQAVLTTEPSISTSIDITTPVGEYSDVITLTGGVDENYDFTFVPADFTVTKATLTVTADDKTKSYSESNLSLTVHYSGFVNGDDEAVINIKPVSSTTALTLSDAGTYPIVAAGGSDNNYDFNYINGTLTITKVPLTVTAESKSKIYGELNPALSFVYSGFVNGEDKTVLDEEPSISTTALQTSNVGDYPITLSGGSDNNYDMVFVDNNLSINKATLVATAEDKTRIYGDANPLLTSVLTGFVNGDDESVIDTKPQSSTTADTHSNTGSYVISVAGGVDNNYNFSYVPGTLIISKSLLTATADNKTKVYGSAIPDLTISYSGFKNNENASVIDILPVASTTALNVSNAGTYIVTLTGGSDNNYDLTLADGNLEITKAPLVITAEDKTKVYGQLNPALSITYSGFVLGENQSVLNIQPAVLTAAGLNSDSGTYDINVSGAADENYAFEYEKGSLTIIKADQVITFDEIPAGLRMTQKHQLTATATSGLPVRFETSDPNIGSLDENVLTIIKEGNLTIAAMQDGDHNWNPATEVTRSIVTLPTFDNINSLFSPNNDGINDKWYIPDLEQYGKLQVTVYNRYGQTVYRSDSYKNDWDGTWNGKPLPSASYYYIMKSSVKGYLKGVVNLVR
jgi:gliding motility-associated-like protein